MSTLAPNMRERLSAPEEKRHLRNLHAFNAQLTPPAIQKSIGARIQQHLFALITELQPGIISFYYPQKGNVDITALAPKLTAMGYSLALPRHVVNSTGFPLTFNLWHPGNPLGHDKYGTACATGPEVRPDVIITPVTAFDAQGFYIGDGRASLDTTVKHMDMMCALIGIAPATCEIENIPREHHDINLDYIITEETIRRPRGY